MQAYSLEEVFLWGVVGLLVFFSVFLWAVYFIGPNDWGTSWAAIPATFAAAVVAVVAFTMHRHGRHAMY